MVSLLCGFSFFLLCGPLFLKHFPHWLHVWVINIPNRIRYHFTTDSYHTDYIDDFSPLCGWSSVLGNTFFYWNFVTLLTLIWFLPNMNSHKGFKSPIFLKNPVTFTTLIWSFPRMSLHTIYTMFLICEKLCHIHCIYLVSLRCEFSSDE